MYVDSLISSAKKYNWLSDDGITNSAMVIQKDGIIQITDAIKQSQWQEFESELVGINRSLIVITDGLPKKWVTNKKLKVLRVQSVLHWALTDFKPYLKNYNFNHFNIKTSELEYEYFLMYGRYEHSREAVVKELESRSSVLTNSLYSRPPVDNNPGRSIEDNQIAPLRSTQLGAVNLMENFNTVIKNSQRCHCSVVLENYGLLTETDGTITEKSIWPILAQVPFVWAIAPNRIQQLTEWGFRPNDTPRTDLRSLTEQLLWLRTEFADPTRAQKWQDDQGETINHNLNILKGLLDRIDDEIHQQLVKL